MIFLIVNTENHKEYHKEYYKEYDWEGEDHCNVDENEVKSESIKNKYLLVKRAHLESLLKSVWLVGALMLF